MTHPTLRIVDDMLSKAMLEATKKGMKCEFIVVLSSSARNELWADIDILSGLSIWNNDKYENRYRGVLVAVCNDHSAPSVAVYSRENV